MSGDVVNQDGQVAMPMDFGKFTEAEYEGMFDVIRKGPINGDSGRRGSRELMKMVCFCFGYSNPIWDRMP